MADLSTSDPEPREDKTLDPNLSLNTLQTTMDTFLRAGNVEAVYGPSIRQGETIVIPAAEVLSIAGFGLGAGSGSRGDAGPEETGSGGGGGGGGRVFARPVAAIVIAPEGVRIEPVVDVTKIAVAAFTALGFMAAMLRQMTSKKPPA